MKAIVQHRYGPPDVLQLEEIPKPEIGDDGVLVRVRAASVNALDWHIMRALPHLVRLSEGFRRPKDQVRGVDLAGEVEAVGSAVTEFRPGDAVFGSGTGAFAEYVASRERYLALKPAALSFEQAAAVPTAGYTALQGLRDKGRVQPGQKVLVYGAGGGVGTFAIQIAKALGAEVTAVSRTENVDLLASIGADHVIDYTREDFTTGSHRYDLVVDIGANRSLAACRRVMTPHGTMVMVGPGRGQWVGFLARIARGVVSSRFRNQKMLPFLAQPLKEDLLLVKELIEAGKVTPIIDRCFPLAEAAQAVRHMEEGRAQGKVVISVGGG